MIVGFNCISMRLPVSKERVKDILSLSVVRDSLKLSSSNILLYFLPLIVTPILSRVYTPTDYGEWGIFSSVYTIVNCILFLSYDNALVRTNKEEDIPNLCGLCIIVSTGLTGVLGLIFCLGNIVGIDFFVNFPRLDLLLLILLVSIAHNLNMNLANRYQKFFSMSVANIINGFSQAVFRIVFGTILVISSGLILGTVISLIVASIFLIHSFCKINIKDIKRLAVENKKFPLYDAPSSFLNFSSGQLAIIILAIYFSRADIGCYSMIMQFVLLPIGFIGGAMAKVYYRKVSIAIDDPNQIRTITSQVSKISASLCLLPTIFLVLGGDLFLVWFLGDQWVTADVMALCLAVSSIPVILSESLLPIYRALNKQNVRFKYDAIMFASSIGSLFLVCYLTHNLFLSVLVARAAISIVRFTLFYNIMKLSGMTFSNIPKFFVVAVVFCYIGLFVRLLMKL